MHWLHIRYKGTVSNNIVRFLSKLIQILVIVLYFITLFKRSLEMKNMSAYKCQLGPHMLCQCNVNK